MTHDRQRLAYLLEDQLKDYAELRREIRATWAESPEAAHGWLADVYEQVQPLWTE